ncbi:MAG: PKD domain-containing protein [Acidobacteriota bacterium]
MVKGFRYLIISLSAVFFLSVTASANTYYVSTAGNNNNPGTEALPWQTIQYAVDHISAGDTILVASGAYAGCRIGRSGTPTAPCTLKAATGAAVLINSLSPANRHQSLIEIENFDGVVSYWIIDGFEVANGARYGIDLRFTDHVTVQNCRAHGSRLTGIFLAFCYYPVIENNESFSNGEHGIYQSNSGDYPVIRNNNLHHNYAAGLHMNGDRNFTPGDGIISFATVEKNIVWENGVGGGSGINCDGVSDSIIRNNLLYNNRASGISLYAIDGAEGSSRNRVYNNTIVMPANGRWCINIPASTEGQSNPAGNKIKNNILYNAHSFRGAINLYSDLASGFESDYNIIVPRFSTDGGDTNMNLSQWQSRGYDLHSVAATLDQLFIDAAALNFRLKSTSPAQDFGASLTDVTDDIEGVSRPQGAKHDAGCYETVQSPQAPVADFSASPVSGNAPLTVQFTDLSTAATAWQWDFGDGGSSTQKNPSHTYQNAGSYSVVLTASNAAGMSVKTRIGYITVSQTPPVAQDYACSSVAIDVGKVRAGNHTSVHLSDGVYLQIKSGSSDGFQTVQSTYLFETSLPALSSLVVTVEAKVSVKPQQQRVMLFNFATGQWDTLDDRRITSKSDQTVLIDVSNPALYISSSGQVRVRLRSGDVTASRWKHSIDLVKITAAP